MQQPAGKPYGREGGELQQVCPATPQPQQRVSDAADSSHSHLTHARTVGRGSAASSSSSYRYETVPPLIANHGDGAGSRPRNETSLTSAQGSPSSMARFRWPCPCCCDDELRLRATVRALARLEESCMMDTAQWRWWVKRNEE